MRFHSIFSSLLFSLMFFVSACGGSSPKTYKSSEILEDLNSIEAAANGFTEAARDSDTTIQQFIARLDEFIASLENYERKYSSPFKVEQDVDDSQINNEQFRLLMQSTDSSDQVKMTKEGRDVLRQWIARLKEVREDLVSLQNKLGPNYLVTNLPGFEAGEEFLAEPESTIPVYAPSSAPVTPAPFAPHFNFNSSGQTGTASVSGTVYAPNGVDPVPNALVYLPKEGNNAQNIDSARIAQSQIEVLPCGEPTEPYLLKQCSDYKGGFDFEGLNPGDILIRIRNGGFTKRIEVFVVSGENRVLTPTQSQLPTADSEDGSTAKIAVIAGQYDKLQDVLKKLGMTESSGFELFYPYGSGRAQTEKVISLISSADELSKYDLVMINCGSSLETYLEDEGIRSAIKAYVQNGGRLYVTDQAYDVVEQIFPRAIRFAGDPSNDAVKSSMNAAEQGTGGLQIKAQVDDQTLLRWLRDRVCFDPIQSISNANCVNADGSVSISGFSGQWALMDSVGPGTTAWISSQANGKYRPLTALFNHGAGKVLYSSYHTHHSGNATVPTPQERVLQYFVFEVLR